MRVAVLGCGPSGLLAAHALEGRGDGVRIFSLKRQSPMDGAQYLHEGIEGITDPEPEYVTFAKVGQRAGYARKVYGSEEAPTSWDIFGIGEYAAWPLHAAYERLWDRYEGKIIEGNIKSGEVDDLCSEHDLVLSSIPAHAICRQRLAPDGEAHRFDRQNVYICDAPMIGVRNLVVYNGREDDPWYRASNLFGHTSVEFSEVGLPNLPDTAASRYPMRKGTKPIGTDCDCHLSIPNFRRIGRFGQWQKEVLTTHARHRAIEAAHQMDLKVAG